MFLTSILALKLILWRLKFQYNFSTEIHPFFKWLDDNYDARPKWNFYKFVINKDGKLENHFSSQVSPSSKKLISLLDEVIK